MDTSEIPQELIDILDLRAGKIHSRNGRVVKALAEILTEYDRIKEGKKTMKELLPIDTEVLVTPNRGDGSPPYKAIICGYDMGRTKYQLRPEIMGWSETHYHPKGIRWAFLSEVAPLEAES